MGTGGVRYGAAQFPNASLQTNKALREEHIYLLFFTKPFILRNAIRTRLERGLTQMLRLGLFSSSVSKKRNGNGDNVLSAPMNVLVFVLWASWGCGCYCITLRL